MRLSTRLKRCMLLKCFHFHLYLNNDFIELNYCRKKAFHQLFRSDDVSLTIHFIFEPTIILFYMIKMHLFVLIVSAVSVCVQLSTEPRVSSRTINTVSSSIVTPPPCLSVCKYFQVIIHLKMYFIAHMEVNKINPI